MERWIGKFELAIEIDEMDSKEAQVLSMYLSESAFDVYNNLSYSDKQDAAAIKSGLRKAFGMKRIDAWRAAISKKNCVGESLDVAGEEIKKWFKIVCEGGSATDYITGMILLDCLPIRIREQVSLMVGNDLAYSDVLSAAKRIWPGKVENSMCVCAGFNFQQNTDNVERNTTNFPRRFPPPRCIGCKRLGHLKRDCKTVCYRCHQVGHVSRDCSAVSLNSAEGTTITNTVVPQSDLNTLQQQPRSQQH